MPDSQDFNQTTISTVARLLEVDSELAVTEAELVSQLESIQQKRRSLKTVLDLFKTTDTPATKASEEPVRTPPAEFDKGLEPAGSDLAAHSLETSPETATAQLLAEVAPTPQSNPVKNKAASSTRSNKTKKVSHSNRVEKIASGWQQYVREEFNNCSLAQAVSLVLQRGAEQVFEIPAVVNSIFVDEFPKSVESKVRRQVTNVLSDGARKNKWYRGQIGQYSMSRAAALS